MTESITTPTALVQTTNGERFYVNSGLISVNNTETTIIEITNVGERDIKLIVNPIVTFDSQGDNMTMKVKNNGLIIYQSLYDWRDGYLIGPVRVIRFIIPANTSLEITFQNTTDASAHDCGVSCYGRYLSM